MSWLESLDVSSSSKAATDLSRWRGMTKLRRLHLPNIVPNRLRPGKRGRSDTTRQLDLDYSKITDAGLVHLSGLTRSRLSNCQNPFDRCRHGPPLGLGRPHESVADDQPSDRHRRGPLRRLANLTSWTSGRPLDRCRHGAPRRNEVLSSLELGTSAPLSEEGMASLAGMSQLESLLHRRAGHYRSGLVHLKGFRRLAYARTSRVERDRSRPRAPGALVPTLALNLSKSKVTDAAVPYLAKLTSLRSLTFPTRPSPDVGRAKLREALGHCNADSSSRPNHNGEVVSHVSGTHRALGA